jgi:hypothetical protein
MELPEAQPAALGDGTVLHLSTRARDGGLTLGRLRHKVVVKVDVVARRGVAGVGATCLVRI